MVRLLNKKDEILKKVDEIIDYIENSDNYKKYLIIKEKMNNDQEINDLINEVKHLQKRLANHYNKQLEIELEEKNKLLNNIPLYREYLNTLDEINNIYNIIENSLNKYFYDKLN